MNAKQEALLRKAARSIVSAEKQLADGDADFAASRAYYAMFYAAEALLLAHDLVYKKHSAVIAAFAEHFTRKGILPEELHRFFIDAQNARLSGDYMSEMDVSIKEVQVHIDHAREFVTTITKHLHV
ncbi:MAG: HEPN domain-containing protein [Calditrichaeota bacterium]|nr:HEPN domain-containing protein [Calditrichota bacterium]MCB9369335.1 HEPN domain-containing protein [Calditrichota bacterium]